MNKSLLFILLCPFFLLVGCTEENFEVVPEETFTPWELAEITRADIGYNNNEELVYLASLQGIVNRNRPEIFLHSGDIYTKWIEEMKQAGYTFKRRTLKEITALYLNRAKGYILVDDELKNTYIAASLAGIYDAVILTEKLAAFTPYNKLPMLADVRDKDEAWLADFIEQNASSFNLTAIVNYDAFPFTMIDYAIANKYPCCNNQKSDGVALQKLYSLIDPNSPHYGFSVPYDDERRDVIFGCETNGIYTVPGINTMSMSVLSSIQLPEVEVTHEDPVLPNQESAHYVTIVFSDGDNTSYLLDLFTRDTYITHPQVADVPISWMYAPTIQNNMRPVHNWYLKNLPEGHCYIGALSGAGYTFPSHHKYVDDYFGISNNMLKECNMDYMVLMDDVDEFDGESEQSYETFMKKNIQYLPDVKGFFYVNYLGYSRWSGKSFKVDGKPVVSFRYFMNVIENFYNQPRTPEEIAQDLNENASRDISSMDAYSAIIVHVNAPSSYDMNDILSFKEMLNDDVLIVNADQFFELIQSNVKD